MVIARFIRENGTNDATLQAYEKLCAGCRQNRVFYLGQYANLSASIILSVLAGAFAVASLWVQTSKLSRRCFLIGLLVVGFALIIALWRWHRRVIERVEKPVEFIEDEVEDQQ